MVKINTFSVKGTKLAAVSLPKELEVEPNLNLLAQAIHVYSARQHTGFSSSKTRGEVNRTKKKLYRQKGTGGARHGARSAPIFVGGGVAHGPRPVKRELALPQAVKQKALRGALAIRAKEGKVIAVNGLSKIKKTKEVQSLIDKVLKEKNKKVTFVLLDTAKGLQKAFANIENARVVPFKNLNAYDVFLGGVLILDKQSLASFTGKDVFGKKEK